MTKEFCIRTYLEPTDVVFAPSQYVFHHNIKRDLTFLEDENTTNVYYNDQKIANFSDDGYMSFLELKDITVDKINEAEENQGFIPDGTHFIVLKDFVGDICLSAKYQRNSTDEIFDVDFDVYEINSDEPLFYDINLYYSNYDENGIERVEKDDCDIEDMRLVIKSENIEYLTFNKDEIIAYLSDENYTQTTVENTELVELEKEFKLPENLKLFEDETPKTFYLINTHLVKKDLSDFNVQRLEIQKEKYTELYLGTHTEGKILYITHEVSLIPEEYMTKEFFEICYGNSELNEIIYSVEDYCGELPDNLSIFKIENVTGIEVSTYINAGITLNGGYSINNTKYDIYNENNPFENQIEEDLKNKHVHSIKNLLVFHTDAKIKKIPLLDKLYEYGLSTEKYPVQKEYHEFSFDNHKYTHAEANIFEILKKEYNIEHTKVYGLLNVLNISFDGNKINYKGDIEIADKPYSSIKDVLGIQFNTVEGNFILTNCHNMNSLFGIPENILGDFYCTHLPILKEFDFIPYFIRGDFKISDCPEVITLNPFSRTQMNRSVSVMSMNIENLKGLPNIVYRDLNITNCDKLEYLRNSPDIVLGDVNITRNKSLLSLELGVKICGGSFDCSANFLLEDLYGGPHYVAKNYTCNKIGKLKSLEGLPPIIEEDLDISNTSIKDFRHCSKLIKGNLNIGFCDCIESTEGFPKKVLGNVYRAGASIKNEQIEEICFVEKEIIG